MKPKDKIIAIDGVSTYNLTSERGSREIKRKKRIQKVKSYCCKRWNKRPKEVEITRAVVELKYVKSKMVR